MPNAILATKVCTRCKQDKPYSEFRKKLDKLTSACAQCLSEADKAYRLKLTEAQRAERLISKREYHAKNPHIKREGNARFLTNSPEKHKAAQKRYYERNKDYFYEKSQRWMAENPERSRESMRKAEAKMRESNPLFALKKRLRSLVGGSLKNRGLRKHASTERILGCTWEELYRHIESQFVGGMSWSNRSQWHIDHVIPLASAESEEELIGLNHYTNLQPLWAIDNLLKGAKLDWNKYGNAKKETQSCR